MSKAIQKLSLSTLICCYVVLLAGAQVVPISLQVENSRVPVGSSIEPLFSWVVDFYGRTISQTSYQILVSGPHPGEGYAWNSGVIESNRTQLIQYTGSQLRPNTHYTWSVNVSTSAGSGVAYSEFITGLSTINDLDYRSWRGKRDQNQVDLMNYFNSSSWIWTADGNTKTAPPGNRAFRYHLDIPFGEAALSAMIFLCVDNLFTLYVNGQWVDANNDGAAWRAVRWSGVLFAPNTTQIVFAINGTNSHGSNDSHNPAGVLVAFQITLTDGTSIFGHSDKTWLSNTNVPVEFQSPTFDDRSWVPAKELVQFGGAPWQTDIHLHSNFITFAPPPPTTPSNVASPSTPNSTTPSSDSDRNKAEDGSGTRQNFGVIVGGVLGSVILILLVLVVYLWYRQKTMSLTHIEQIHPPSSDREHRYSNWIMSQDVPSSVFGPRRVPSISVSPSMSVSAVAERNRRKWDATQHADNSADVKTELRLEASKEC